MNQLDTAVKEFNENSEKQISISLNNSNERRYEFHMGKNHIGYVIGIANHSNCGVFDLHNLSSIVNQHDIILKFMIHLCTIYGHSILTYNTSDKQTPIKNVLEKNGFHTVGKTFRNKSSGKDIEFHILDVYNG